MNNRRLDVCADCFHGDVCDNYINGRQSCLYFTDKHNIAVIKHGEWSLEPDEDEPDFMFKLLVCSVCDGKANDTYDFCPNCGAHMTKKKETNDVDD